MRAGRAGPDKNPEGRRDWSERAGVEKLDILEDANCAGAAIERINSKV